MLAESSLASGDAQAADRFEATLAAAIERGLVRDAVIAASEAQRADFWRLRETIPEAQGREGASLKHDISVEPARLPAFVDAGRALLERLAPGARLVAYGHLGDGNLHYNLSEPAGGDGGALAARAAEVRRAVHDLVAAHGGSISAEHGIGQLKVGELERYEDPVALELMRTVKRAIDPHGIMNPGKVLRDQSGSRARICRSRRNA